MGKTVCEAFPASDLALLYRGLAQRIMAGETWEKAVSA
jgi:nitrogenase subunit NifH